MTAPSYTKKAQMQITETIMVLFVFFILLAIMLFFYYQYSIQNIKNIGEEVTEEKASILLYSVTSTPELRCSSLTEEEDCIDTTKLLAFKALVKNNEDHYSAIFGYATITVEQLYPEINSTEECIPSNYQNVLYPDNCKYWEIYSKLPQKYRANPVIYTPISLYFPNTDEYRIGKLTMRVYL